MGASSDGPCSRVGIHGGVEPVGSRVHLSARAAGEGESPKMQSRFTAHMIMESARMSIEDGLVMQLHVGAIRDHNDLIYHASVLTRVRISLRKVSSPETCGPC